MCGICGIVSFDPTASVAGEMLKEMCDLIQHRGPDEDGFFLDSAVGLGMRRLSIIDLSGGHQPVYNEAGTACVVFNGEIYNYQALTLELEKRGHCFTTHSDTEVIIHGYEEWGEALPEHLHGMFVLAIWDSARERLFIARDRLGKKPLYYYHGAKRFIFGSEIKSILLAQPDCRRINWRALDAFISLGYVPGPDTMFADIHKLPAGHSLTLTLADGRFSLREFWDLRFGPETPMTVSQCRERVQDLLTDAVRVRLMSDVPLGAFLSGGLDSSVVVGLMSQVMDQPVNTFSVGFEEKEHNELPYARIIAQHFGTNHHEIIVDNCDSELMERLVWHMDEPVADPAAVPTLLVSELARRHVTVVLTGEGGDELFAGYSHYRTMWGQPLARMLPEALRRRALPALARIANGILGRPRYHARTIWRWSLPEARQLLAAVGIFTDAEKTRLYHPAFRLHAPGDTAGEALSRFYQRSGARDGLHRLMYLDTKIWLADDLLMKVDKMSMAHSLEARTPYLDHRLIEFMATVPAALKTIGGTPKRILREVAKTLLPATIINRPKHTFDVPIGKWLTSGLREMTLDLVAHGRVAGEQVFNPDHIMGEMWHGLETGRPGYARQIWSLLYLALWARKFGMMLVCAWAHQRLGEWQVFG